MGDRLSLLHAEELRRCKVCAHEWLAEHYTRLDAQPPILGQGLTAHSQALHRQTVHERRLSKHERWRICPSCGSKKVKTIAKGKGAAKAFAKSSGITAPTVSTPTQERNPLDDLSALTRLRDEGVLSPEEFEKKKAELLDRL